ncbi:MAG: hypothetical protein PGN15_08065 [Aeromicrobium erythreum]
MTTASACTASSVQATQTSPPTARSGQQQEQLDEARPAGHRPHLADVDDGRGW